MAEAQPRRRFGRLRQVALALLACVVVLVFVVVLGGPSIIAALAPIVASRLGLPGRVEVEAISLSWRGKLEIGRAALYDHSERHVASVSVRTSGGLLGLLDGQLDRDIVIDGWATVEIAEDGSSNIERALGLERRIGAGAPAETKPEREVSELPFSRIVLDGMDVSLTRAGSPTLAVAGLSGTLEAEGQRVRANAKAGLAMPATPPQTRREIEEAPGHGAFELSADLGLADLTGQAQARVMGLTPELAAAIGALSGDDTVTQAAMIAALDGLELEVQATLASGVPSEAMVRLKSGTLSADLSLATRDGVIGLDAPGTVEVDTAAFLGNETIRQRILPGEGVAVSQAGRLTLTLDRLRVPMDGMSPRLEAAQGEARLRVGRTMLTVPGLEGETVEIRVNELSASAFVEVGKPLQLNAMAKAGVRGQADGNVSIRGVVDTRAIMPMVEEGHGIDVGVLVRVVPSVAVTLEGVPTLAAKPWLGTLEAMGLEVPRVVGPTVNASLVWARGEGDAADITLEVDGAHLKAGGGARWTSEAIVLTAPVSLSVARPNAIAAAWLPEGAAMENGRGVTATVPELRVPMNGWKPDLSRAVARAVVGTGGVRLHMADAPTLGLIDLELRLAANGSGTTLEMDSKPTVNGLPAMMSARLRSAGLGTLLDSPGGSMPVVLGSVSFAGTSKLAGVLEKDVAGRPLQQWLEEAVGPDLSVRLDLGEPSEGTWLAGELFVEARHAKFEAKGIGLSGAGASLAGATLVATPSEALWYGIATIASLEGSSLAATSPIVVEVGAARYPFGNQDQPPAGAVSALASGLEATAVRVVAQKPIRINGVPIGQPDAEGQRHRADVSFAVLAAGLNSLGRAIGGGPNVEGTIEVTIEAPERGRVASVNGVIDSGEQGALEARLTIDELSTELAAALAGLGGGASEAVRGSLGADGRVELHAMALARPGQPTPWVLKSASLDVQTPRLTTAQPITLIFSADSISLSRPASLTWTPDAGWLETAIGARVASVRPFEITLDRAQVGNPLAGEAALLDPALVFIDASLVGEGATIAIKDRPGIELETVQARVRRIAESTYGVTGRAATAGGGTLDLNGLVSKPTDAQGRLSLETAVVRGTLKGDDVPVALADALSNADGLLSDALGEVVDLDAEIHNGRLVPGEPPVADLRFSVRGPRADASGYGRLANHVISMPESQTVLTVREVKPEIAQRFSQIIPELLRVEKRPEDGPAVIRTEGLSIPTNGDWTKGQGRVVVALGTARFRTSSVLSSVLKVTGQRERGSLGRRIDPITIVMTDGVITYQPFDLPIGDLSLHSEGTVNLPANTMDVLVWIPMAALSDEAAGRFNTGLGSAIGRTIPGFGSATTVPWRVSGPLDKPEIRPAPRVLIERRGEQLFGPIMRPGETLQDLLSIPRRREQPSGGG